MLFSGLVLMDESNGDIVGDLAMPFNEENDLQNKIDAGNDKDPVVVSFDGTTTPNGTPNIQVNTLADITAKYGQSNSKIVGGAEYLSRGTSTAISVKTFADYQIRNHIWSGKAGLRHVISRIKLHHENCTHKVASSLLADGQDRINQSSRLLLERFRIYE